MKKFTLFIIGLCFLSTTVISQNVGTTTFNNSATNLEGDNVKGLVLIDLTDLTAHIGKQVTSYTFLVHDGTGADCTGGVCSPFRTVTLLLVENTSGNNYKVVGVGANYTINNGDNGTTKTIAFGLTSGTNIIAANYKIALYGWCIWWWQFQEALWL